MAEERSFDASADECGTEISNDGLDFGEFGHPEPSRRDGDRSLHSRMDAAVIGVFASHTEMRREACTWRQIAGGEKVVI
jgi:hypothetical protein